MILTAHILAGASISARIKNPFLGLFLAFLSHYAIDALPHEEYSIQNIRNRRWRKSLFDFLKVFIDMAIGFVIIAFISKKIGISLLGGLFGLIPDGLTLLFLLFPKINFLKKHFTIHASVMHLTGFYSKIKEISPALKIITQLLVSAIAVLLISGA